MGWSGVLASEVAAFTQVPSLFRDSSEASRKFQFKCFSQCVPLETVRYWIRSLAGLLDAVVKSFSVFKLKHNKTRYDLFLHKSWR